MSDPNAQSGGCTSLAADAGTPGMLAAALAYAAQGWPVFPVKARGKAPATERGFYDAVTNDAAVRELWRERAFANVGIRCGGGVLVIDVDGEEGADSLAQLEAAHGPLPSTYSVTTPGGGQHYYFRVAVEIRNSTSELAPSIDVRGDGGYVVAPPSLGPNGRRYEVDHESSVADCPDWLVELLLAPKAPDDNDAAPEVTDSIPRGQRNATLTSLAGSMRHRGLGAAEILPSLEAINRRRCRPPLPPNEVKGIATSVSRYEPARTNGWNPSHAQPRFGTRPADVNAMRPLKFVWWPFLVSGALNLMVGEEKVGKSTFSIWIAAELTRGTLPGVFEGEPRDVLFIGADEDDWESVVLPRLYAAGADFERVHEFVGAELFNVADHTNDLTRVLSHCPSPLGNGTVGHKWGLVVCEHLMDLLPPMKSYTDPAALRHATRPLRRALRASGVAGLATLHVNKAEAASFRQRSQGSIQFAAMSRSAFLLDRHPKNRDCRIAVLGAANNVRDDEAHAVAFKIESASFEHNAQSFDVGKVVDVEADNTSIREVLAGGEPQRTREKRERRRRVLTVLTGEPQTIRQNAKAASVPRSSLQRLLEELEDEEQPRAKQVEGGWVAVADDEDNS